MSKPDESSETRAKRKYVVTELLPELGIPFREVRRSRSKKSERKRTRKAKWKTLILARPGSGKTSGFGRQLALELTTLPSLGLVVSAKPDDGEKTEANNDA